MAATIRWQDDTHTVLEVNLGNAWNWHIFEVTIDEAFALIEATLHPVDLIVGDDMLGQPMPAGSPISHFLRAAQIMPPNLGRVIAIIGTDLSRVAVNVLVLLSLKARHRVIAVRSWEEAQRVIQQERLRSMK